MELQPPVSDELRSRSQLEATLRRRRMVRSFTDAPVERSKLDTMLDLARRAPSAGNTQATAFLVLDSATAVSGYWDITLPPAKRQGFRWTSLLDAPVIVVVLTRPDAYVERYAEPDKARPGLGDSAAQWGVPYWWVDAGAVIQNLLLLVTDAGLGACLFGLFDNEEAVLQAHGVPDEWRAVGTIALGHPAPDAAASSQRGRSAERPRPPIDEIIHRGRWTRSSL